jgi:hypothetical protein
MVDRMEKIIAAGEADHEAVRLQERAAVVAWLRAYGNRLRSSYRPLLARLAERFADAIERGEHLKGAA